MLEFKSEDQLEDNLLESVKTQENSESSMFDPLAAPPSTCKMVKLFARLTTPAILTNVLAFVSVLINTIFAGQMGDPVKLAAIGLSNVIVIIMVQSLLVGLNSA